MTATIAAASEIANSTAASGAGSHHSKPAGLPGAPSGRAARHHHPKTGERRSRRQRLLMDSLPLALLDRARAEHAAGHTWGEIERDSPHWPEWEGAPPEMLAEFPGRRLPHSTVHRWYDLRVDQLRRAQEEKADAARALTAQLAHRGIEGQSTAVATALSEMFFGVLLEGAGTQPARQELTHIARAMATVQRLDLEQRRLELAARKAEPAQDEAETDHADTGATVEWEDSGDWPFEDPQPAASATVAAAWDGSGNRKQDRKARRLAKKMEKRLRRRGAQAAPAVSRPIPPSPAPSRAKVHGEDAARKPPFPVPRRQDGSSGSKQDEWNNNREGRRRRAMERRGRRCLRKWQRRQERRVRKSEAQAWLDLPAPLREILATLPDDPWAKPRASRRHYPPTPRPPEVSEPHELCRYDPQTPWVQFPAVRVTEQLMENGLILVTEEGPGAGRMKYWKHDPRNLEQENPPIPRAEP
jgi:hypothetical protein